MRLYSYVVRNDSGFAPNPFHGTCSLATCKPDIRRTASAGDWIVGTGSKTQNRQGNLVYVMQVAEDMTFNQYWTDVRFQLKKPSRGGSFERASGDNIYLRDLDGSWHQSDSRHSLADGSPDECHIVRDTKVDRVLIGGIYAYWGGSGPTIPSRFRNWRGQDICKQRRGHKCRFPRLMVDEFVAWFMALDQRGYLNGPLDWKKPSCAPFRIPGCRGTLSKEPGALRCRSHERVPPRNVAPCS